MKEPKGVGVLKGTKPYFLILVTGFVLKCETVLIDNPDRYETMTRNGFLYVKDGDPPKFLLFYGDLWSQHSWLVHNSPKPADVDLVPFSTEINSQIVDEINVRRAKTLLGAYFDPERPTDFGVLPPAAHLSTVEYNEEIAETAERFIQHSIFQHHNADEFFPHVPLGENLHTKFTATFRVQGTDTLENVKKSTLFNVEDYVSRAFNSWFEKELMYYKHVEPYLEKVHDAYLMPFREVVRNDENLSEEDKNWDIQFKVQFGHAISVIARNMHSVGCALSRRMWMESPVEYKGNLFDKYRFQNLFGCKFGGGAPENGKIVYDMDEGLLHMHGISKSMYDPPTSS